MTAITMRGGPPDEIEPTAAELLVLELLGTEERRGLELVKASGGKLKRGTVYVTLGRAEERGLLSSREEAEIQPHIMIPRRLYRATRLGRQLLAAYK